MADGGLSLLPKCAQAGAAAGIASSGCGTDEACLCTSNAFLLTIQGVIATRCSPSDGQKTLDFARQLCTAAVPNLKDSRAPMVLAILSTLTVLSIVAVIARLVARRMSKVALWWDDYTIIVALVLTFGLNINNLYAVHFGYGRHIVTLQLSEILNFAKINFSAQLLFAWALTATKLSILFLYLRIFPSHKFKIASIVAGVLNIAWCISLTGAIIFSCKPVEYFWDKSIPNGYCHSQNTRGYGITAANFITDLAVWLLPIPWLWGLQMETSRKLAVIGMFLLGGLVCLAPLIRLPLLVKLNEADITWTIVDAGIWLNVECNIGIVCACLPGMRGLFKSASSRPSHPTRSSKYTRTDSRSGGSSALRTSSSERIVGGKADNIGVETAVSISAPTEAVYGGVFFDVSSLTAQKGVSIAMPELPRRNPPWNV